MLALHKLAIFKSIHPRDRRIGERSKRRKNWRLVQYVIDGTHNMIEDYSLTIPKKVQER
jgi:hypothetical protein